MRRNRFVVWILGITAFVVVVLIGLILLGPSIRNQFSDLASSFDPASATPTATLTPSATPTATLTPSAMPTATIAPNIPEETFIPVEGKIAPGETVDLPFSGQSGQSLAIIPDSGDAIEYRLVAPDGESAPLLIGTNRIVLEQDGQYIVRLSVSDDISADAPFEYVVTLRVDSGSAVLPTHQPTREVAETEEPPDSDDPTPEPTEEPSAGPTEIGRGEITVENNDSVRQGDSVTIELVLDNIAWESFFDPPQPEEEFGGAPAPGAITIPAPRNLGSGAILPQTTPVIRMQRVPVYPRMGAWIQCPPDVFSGCDNDLPGQQLPPITTRAESFTWPAWILTASEDYSGILEDDVRIYVYYVMDPNAAITVDNIRYIGDPIRVPLEVVAVAGGIDPALIAGAALGLLILGGVAAYALTRNRRTGGANYSGDESKPQVFISYRRGISWSLARSIANSLQQRGADVFIDVDDINEGRFASTIEQAIETADYVVPILAPGTLESAWVRREIAYAIAHDKIMIPLLTDGFQLDARDLPDEIREMASHNAITILPEFYEAAIDRLASRFLKLDEPDEDTDASTP